MKIWITTVSIENWQNQSKEVEVCIPVIFAKISSFFLSMFDSPCYYGINMKSLSKSWLFSVPRYSVYNLKDIQRKIQYKRKKEKNLQTFPFLLLIFFTKDMMVTPDLVNINSEAILGELKFLLGRQVE